MAVTRQDIILWKDSDYTAVFHAPSSLENRVVVWKMALSLADNPLIVKTSHELEEIRLEGNYAYVFLDSQDTVSLGAGEYVHEARATADGLTHTMAVGRVSLYPVLTGSAEMWDYLTMVGTHFDLELQFVFDSVSKADLARQRDQGKVYVLPRYNIMSFNRRRVV